MLDVQSTYEVRMLDAMLERELGCQSKHAPDTMGYNDNGCTVEVTHRHTGCNGQTLLCESRAVYLLEQLPDRNFKCVFCLTRGADCWKIIPI